MPNPANRFHLYVYKVRPDVQSIIHTHPPYISALSMLGEELAISHMDTSMFYEDCAWLPEWPGVTIGEEEGDLITNAHGGKSAILLEPQSGRATCGERVSKTGSDAGGA